MYHTYHVRYRTLLLSIVLLSGLADDGQTNIVSFETMSGRRAVERHSEPADCGRVDDGQTNSVLFD